MILYFKRIRHIDDFPLNGHPPSTKLKLAKCSVLSVTSYGPIRGSTILEYVVEYMNLNHCVIGDSFEFNVDSYPLDKHHNVIAIVLWRASDLYSTTSIRHYINKCIQYMHRPNGKLCTFLEISIL